MKNSFLFFLLLITTNLFSQKKTFFAIPDSLKGMDFETLQAGFDNSLLDTQKHAVYAKTYYKKSKLQNDEMIKLNGMYMLGYVSSEDSLFTFTDSIITLTKHKNNFVYPARAYILRSIIFFTNGHFNKALDNIINAEKYSNKAGNTEQQIFINQQIGLIKIELDKPEEALPLILENYNYYKNKNSNSPYYIYSVWILSNIYNRLNQPDKALYYTDLFFKKMGKDDYYYKYFMLNKAVSYHLKKEYALSNNLLDKSIDLLEDDKINLAIGYYYKGENILREKKDDLKSKIYFEKVDSILLTTTEFTSLLRKNYLNLIAISKRQQDHNMQLYFLNRLIEIDEKLNKNNVILSENMHQVYNIPHLMKQKEDVISKIKNEKKIYIVIGTVIFAMLLLTLFYFHKMRKQKEFAEERFKILMSDRQIESNYDSNTNVVKDEQVKSFDLPAPVSKEILQKLITFEKQQGYLELNLKLSDLSTRFETNNSYLSKVINHHKNKNFSQYINDLRITYAVKKIKTDKKFCKYTIKAIAQEVGFSNTESFAKAFYNNTGLQPSFFIKKIIENN